MIYSGYEQLDKHETPDDDITRLYGREEPSDYRPFQTARQRQQWDNQPGRIYCWDAGEILLY
jgi:hypothetical protein